MPDQSLYASYTEFKTWGDEAAANRPEDFASLLRDAGLPPGPLDILDYGFGDGGFLDWAKGAGHRVTGVEILPAMIAAARARGHQVYDAGDAALARHRFDAIVLMDVMEHLDNPTFAGLMAFARDTLKPQGRLIARFPNGDSPFAGRYQNGDLTHDKPLTANSVRQWAVPHGMALAKSFNPRSIPPGFARAIKRRLTYAARNLVETLLGFVYFGYRFPMDPNVAIVLMRAEETSGKV